MSVVSSCDGVMGVEERLSAESGYTSRKIVGSHENVWTDWTLAAVAPELEYR